MKHDFSDISDMPPDTKQIMWKCWRICLL